MTNRRTKKNSEGQALRWEKIRCLRLGQMLRLFNHRYGVELPDDDAGLAEIWLLIQNTSLALHEPEKKMRHIIEARAPWLPKDKAEERMEFAMKLTRQERSPSSVELGECMRVTAGEWVALRVTQFTPMDITAEELRAMRKTIRNARRRGSGSG